MMYDLRNNIDAVTSAVPVVRNATVNGTGVDLGDFNAAVVIFQAGAITDGTHVPSVQESVDNSVWTNTAAADLEGALANITTNSIQRIGYKGTRRFIRAVVTVTPGATGGVYGAIVLRSAGRHLPLA